MDSLWGTLKCKEMREGCENSHSHQLEGRRAPKMWILSIVLGDGTI